MNDADILELKIKTRRLEEMLFAVSTYILQTAETSGDGEYHEETATDICKLYLHNKWDERDGAAYIAEKHKRQFFYE